MALASRPVEVQVSCPSPARVASTGSTHSLLRKERHMDHPTYASRGNAGAGTKSSKDFVHVCREVVSVSCGQPLLSYKPKRTKSTKDVMASEGKFGRPKAAPDSNTRSVASRVVTNAIRLAGVSETVSAAELMRGVSAPELRRGESLAKATSSRLRSQDLDATTRRTVSCGDGFDLDQGRRISLASVEADPPLINLRKGGYPAFQRPSSSLGAKACPDDYHKALIPFLRAEWHAAAKILKGQVPKRGVHRRSTSLGSTDSTLAPAPDQKAWQSYTRLLRCSERLSSDRASFLCSYNMK